MKTVYLCGGINGLSDVQCKDWRETVKCELNGKFNFLDPMRRDYRGKEVDSVNEIVEGDMADISASDILLVNANKPSWGTAMETYAAFVSRKHYVIAFCDNDKPSPWLVYHTHKLVKSLEKAVSLLRSAS